MFSTRCYRRAVLITLAVSALGTSATQKTSGREVVLVVNTTDPNGSGPGILSLPDAIALSVADPAANTVLFDPSVFPPAAPAVIALTQQLPVLISDGDILDGSGAGVVLDGGLIPPGSFHGLEITGAGIVVRRITLRRFPDAGVRVRASGSVRLESVTIEDSGEFSVSGMDGVRLTESADAELRNCEILRSRGDGVDVRDSAQLVLVDTRIEDSHQAGILLGDATSVTVSGCVVSRSLDHGVLTAGTSYIEMVDTTVEFSADDGIEIRSATGTTNADLTRVRVEGSGDAGLSLWPFAICVADRLVLAGNANNLDIAYHGLLRDITGKSTQTPLVNVADLIPVRNSIGDAWLEHDLDGSGTVDPSDLVVFNRSVGTRFRPIHSGNQAIPDLLGGGAMHVPYDAMQHVVILPEGYSQQKLDDGTFDGDVLEWLDEWITLEPYPSFRGAFAVWKLYEPSNGASGSGDTAFALPIIDYGGSVPGVGYVPCDGEPASRVWSVVQQQHPWSPLYFYPSGGRLTYRAKNLVVVILVCDPDTGRSGVSGRAVALCRPGDTTERLSTALAKGLIHEFSHAFARLRDEYIEDNNDPDHTGNPTSYGSLDAFNVVYGTNCDTAPWEHLYFGSLFNPFVENAVGYYGVDGWGFHSEFRCKMNGTHDNATYFCGYGGLRTGHFCNYCRELVVFRLHERLNILPDIGTSYEAWIADYRTPFFDRFPFRSPDRSPELFQACGEAPDCGGRAAPLSDDVNQTCEDADVDEITRDAGALDSRRANHPLSIDHRSSAGLVKLEQERWIPAWEGPADDPRESDSREAPVGSQIVYSIVNPGNDMVESGEFVALEIRATFNTPLVVSAFEVAASGTSRGIMTHRSLAPTGPSGLTYISQTSQDPFDDNLPYDLVATPKLELCYDADFGEIPGGALDGVPPGVDVLLETITVQVDCAGILTVSLSNPHAATTQDVADGAIFESVAVDPLSASVTVTVLPGPRLGDYDCDDDVDLDDFAGWPGCVTGPDGGPHADICAAFDSNADTDVDLVDFGAFQRMFGR